MYTIPFQHIDWASIPKEEFKGEEGTSFWQTAQWQGLRMRIVEYMPGYLADHWCEKGHIVYCLEGSFITTLDTNEQITLEAGMSYIVSDHLSKHKSYSGFGTRILIIDGDFLQGK